MWLNKHETKSLMNEHWRRKSKVEEKGKDIYVLEFPTLEPILENCWDNLKLKDEQHSYRKKGRSCLAEKVGKSVTQRCFCKIHDEICKHFTDCWFTLENSLWSLFFNLNNCLVLHPEAERSKPKLPLKRGQGQETRQLFGELPLFSRQLYIGAIHKVGQYLFCIFWHPLTVSDWVPKKDSANFKSVACL